MNTQIMSFAPRGEKPGRICAVLETYAFVWEFIMRTFEIGKIVIRSFYGVRAVFQSERNLEFGSQRVLEKVGKETYRVAWTL